jgi:hypothetical protein
VGGVLIDPDEFVPGSKHLRPVAVEESAVQVRGLGVAALSRVGRIASLWSGLSVVYSAPEQEKVLSLMAVAETKADNVKVMTDGVARALEAYALVLQPLRVRMLDLERRARVFRDGVIGGVRTSVVGEVPWYAGGVVVAVEAVTSDWRTVSWDEHEPTVQKNNELLREYAGLLSQIEQAVAECERDVNAAAHHMVYAPLAVVYSPEQIMASVNPWGAPATEERNCVEQVYQGQTDSFGGILGGAGSLTVGYDPATGGFFDGAAYGQAWAGLGNLVGSLAVISSGVGVVAGGLGLAERFTGVNVSNDAVSSWMGERYAVVADTAGSLIGWDGTAHRAGEDGWHQWRAEPWRAGASSVVNVGTLF